MPLSLNNSKDIVANSISIIKGDTVVDVLASLEAGTGVTLATLTPLLDAKVDDTEMADYALKTYVNTAVGAKQATLSAGTTTTNARAIFSGTIIKNIVPGQNFRTLSVLHLLFLTHYKK